MCIHYITYGWKCCNICLKPDEITGMQENQAQHYKFWEHGKIQKVVVAKHFQLSTSLQMWQYEMSYEFNSINMRKTALNLQMFVKR